MDFRIAARRRRERRRRALLGAVGVGVVAAVLTALSALEPAVPEVGRSTVWTGRVRARRAGPPGARPRLARGSPGRDPLADGGNAGPGGREAGPPRDPGAAGHRAARALEPGTGRTDDRGRSAAARRTGGTAPAAPPGPLRAAGTAERGRRTGGRGGPRAAESRSRPGGWREAGVVGPLVRRRSQLSAEGLETRHLLEQERLATLTDSSEAQLASKEATVARPPGTARPARAAAGGAHRAGRETGNPPGTARRSGAGSDAGDESRPGRGPPAVEGGPADSGDPGTRRDARSPGAGGHPQRRDRGRRLPGGPGSPRGLRRGGHRAPGSAAAGSAPGSVGGRHHRTPPDPRHAPRGTTRLRPAGEHRRALPDRTRRGKPQCGCRSGWGRVR